MLEPYCPEPELPELASARAGAARPVVATLAACVVPGCLSRRCRSHTVRSPSCPSYIGQSRSRSTRSCHFGCRIVPGWSRRCRSHTVRSPSCPSYIDPNRSRSTRSCQTIDHSYLNRSGSRFGCRIVPGLSHRCWSHTVPSRNCPSYTDRNRSRSTHSCRRIGCRRSYRCCSDCRSGCRMSLAGAILSLAGAVVTGAGLAGAIERAAAASCTA